MTERQSLPDQRSSRNPGFMAKRAAAKAARRQIAGDRRVAGQGADDLQVSGWQLHRRGQHRPYPRSAAGREGIAGRSIKGEKWAYLGVNVDDNFTPVYIVPPEKKPQVTKLKELLKDSRRALSGDGRRPRRGSDQLALVRSAEAEGAGASAGVSRDHDGGDSRRAGQSAEHRRRPGAGPGDAADSRPAVRLRSFAAFVAKDRAEALGRPRAERRRADDRRARAAADRVSLGDLVGFDRHSSPTATASSSRPSWSASMAAGFPSGKDFDPATGKIKDTQLAAARTSSRRGELAERLMRAVPRHAIWKSGPTRASRPSRSPPARCSRRPTASWVSARGGRWTSPKACMRTATSLTCVPIRRTWRRWRSTPPAIWCGPNMAASICPTTPRVYKSKVKNAQEAHEAIRPAGHPFELPGASARTA